MRGAWRDPQRWLSGSPESLWWLPAASSRPCSRRGPAGTRQPFGAFQLDGRDLPAVRTCGGVAPRQLGEPSRGALARLRKRFGGLPFSCTSGSSSARSQHWQSRLSTRFRDSSRPRPRPVHQWRRCG
jgi:hypothetical protein